MSMKDYVNKVKDYDSYITSMHELVDRYDMQELFTDEVLDALIEGTFPNVETNSLILMTSTVPKEEVELWDSIVDLLMNSEDEKHKVISSMLGKAISVLTQYEALLSLSAEALLNLHRGPDGD